MHNWEASGIELMHRHTHCMTICVNHPAPIESLYRYICLQFWRELCDITFDHLNTILSRHKSGVWWICMSFVWRLSLLIWNTENRFANVTKYEKSLLISANVPRHTTDYTVSNIFFCDSPLCIFFALVWCIPSFFVSICLHHISLTLWTEIVN